MLVKRKHSQEDDFGSEYAADFQARGPKPSELAAQRRYSHGSNTDHRSSIGSNRSNTKPAVAAVPKAMDAIVDSKSSDSERDSYEF